MNPASEVDRYSPEQLGQMHDAAKLCAGRLRAQAFDDLWHRLADGWSNRQRRAGRAAERLAGSLARHARLRSTTKQDCPGQAC